MWVDQPAELVLEYTAQLMAWLLFLNPSRTKSLGLLGLGAGSVTKFCLKHTPNRLRVVEWNPLVTAACEMYFKLPRPARLQIEHCDAADWVSDPAQLDSCAVLMVDIYDGQARGPVRDSVEFYQNCCSVLNEVGILTVNLFGAHASFDRNIRNLSMAFGGRLLTLPQIDAGNQVVLAFKGPTLQVSIERLLARAEEVEREYKLPARKWARSMLGRTENSMLVI
jgi:spermidine synthase